MRVAVTARALVVLVPSILVALPLGAQPGSFAPAGLVDAAPVEPLDRHLLRLAEELERRPAALESAEAMLRHLRFVRGRIVAAGGPESAARLERVRRLELQARSGGVALRRPAAEPPPGVAGKVAEKGAVQGTVSRASNGDPIAGVTVLLWHQDGFLDQATTTNAAGSYRFESVAAGRWFVLTENFSGFLDELYDDIPCVGGAFFGCLPTEGTPLEVTETGSVTADFALTQGGAVAGTVTEAERGAPLPFFLVRVWTADGALVRDGFTDEHGRYRIDGLPAGTYFATTENFGEYLDEVYDDIPCRGCDPTIGTPIAVELETTTAGIDFALEKLGRITGTVTDELSGDPIPFVSLEAIDDRGVFVGSGFTDERGRYVIGGLPAGSYFVFTRNPHGFGDEIYDDVPCPPGSCEPTSGTPVPVALNATVSGIDFVLAGGCVESETVLCLNGGRFRVESEWRVPDGRNGRGQALRLTADTGYFWFFSRDNVEQVVKVLNACAVPNFHNFWVFAAGLTNLEVTTTVTDALTGQRKQYRNPHGTAFQPVQDTSSFDTCP